MSILEYDNYGNIIYYKDMDGIESWHEYDGYRNCIYTRRSDGFEYWARYQDGKLAWYKNNRGDEYWFKLD